MFVEPKQLDTLQPQTERDTIEILILHMSLCPPSPTECQQLIKWCLALRPSDRPALEQICDHPWMRATTTESAKSPEEVPAAGDIRLRTIDTDSSSSTSSSKESL